MLNGQSEKGRRKTDRGQRVTGEELENEREIFLIEKGHAALVVQGSFRARMPRVLAGYVRCSSEMGAVISWALSQSPRLKLTRIISEPCPRLLVLRVGGTKSRTGSPGEVAGLARAARCTNKITKGLRGSAS